MLIFWSFSVNAMDDSPAYQKVLPEITLLYEKINTLLDQEEDAGRVRHEDPACTTCVSSLRIMDMSPKAHSYTKQGLLLVYHVDRPLFKLISPAGQHILGGYYGMSAVMDWDDYDYIKKELLGKYLVGQHHNPACDKADFLNKYKAYKISAVNGLPVPNLEYDFSLSS